jgi:DNA polymerase bacteriophage-type
LSVVGDVVRAAICADPGHRLIAADFSGVESRVTAWLAGEQAKLDQWAKFDETQNFEDEPYYHLGCRIGFPAEVARASGKVADLALGFMGGEGAYRKLAPEGDTSNTEDINRQRRAWRDAHPAVVSLWKALPVQPSGQSPTATRPAGSTTSCRANMTAYSCACICQAAAQLRIHSRG